LLRPVGFREHEAISARWHIGQPCFGGASVMASVQSPVPCGIALKEDQSKYVGHVLRLPNLAAGCSGLG
jgi:hypothetical protein